MAFDSMEKLLRVDEDYMLAGDNASSARLVAAEAGLVHYDAAKRRAEQYTLTFARGFVLTRVVAPDRIRYLAGYDEANMFDPESIDEPVHIELDQAHADSLAGEFGYDFEARVTLPGEMDEVGHGFRTSFKVSGAHDNQDTRVELPLRDSDAGFRQYTGDTLDAIEWRLPTPAEIARFGGAIATQQA